MNIIIDKNLRELRRTRGTRQEDLADHLGVSVQTVSKWERGENFPDLTFIPAIASYYNVTVDDLLGVGEMRKRERLDWYKAESRKLQNVGKIPEAVALWREALKEFPNEHKVISELAHAIFYQNSDDTERYNEVIELEERILRESTDQSLRDGAIQVLCLSYDNLGDSEKAKEYANMGGDMYCSRQSLLSQVLKDDEREKYNKHLIVEFADEIGQCSCKLESIPWEKRHEFFLKILELIFDDGFYGFYACRASQRHHWLARIYAGWENQEEKVGYHLEKLVHFAKQYDSLDGEYTYTSTFMKGVKGNSKDYTANTEGTKCEYYLEALTGSDSWMFDRFRETDWFKSALESLKV